MGDRTNPIKFGPEWLRNLPGSPGSGGGGASGGGRSPSTHPPTSPFTHAASPATSSSNTNTSKVLLAKLRYGREEMLALYDRETVEPPEQLKVIDLLYQPRGKPPYALNNSFEDESREASRSGLGGGVGGGGERFIGLRGRAVVTSDARVRPSLPSHRGARPLFRQPSVTRTGNTSWHVSHLRMPFSPEDELAPHATRSWNNNTINNTPTRSTVADQTDWNNKMNYRSKRSNTTNWRQQQGRDDGDEWRTSEAARRNTSLDKWGEREWGEREKPWNNNRRTWLAGDSEDALPEWAVENAECGGTFDSTGAFHGYSNDDSNLPRNQDASYPLARSQTHGAFSRSKTAEEGSDEWWASEKAKKLSPKRFIPDNIADNNKYRRRVPKGISEEGGIMRGESGSEDKEECEPERSESVVHEDTPGNFHSVMLASNNALRQKHQSIGGGPAASAATSVSVASPVADSGVTHERVQPVAAPPPPSDNKPADNNTQHSEEEKRKDKETNKLVEDILDMNLEEELSGVLGGRSRVNVSGVSPPVGVVRGVTNDVLNASLGLTTSLSSAFSQQQRMFPMHPRHFNYQGSPAASAPVPVQVQPDPDPTEHWYYEDPNQMIQGPFSSSEMGNWYKAGFFSPSLMVRRACDPVMRPLATYGPLPFGPIDLLPSFSAYELHRPQPEPLLPTLHPPQHHHHHPPSHSSLSLNVESLWSSGGGNTNTGGTDLLWLQRSTSLAAQASAPAPGPAPVQSTPAPAPDRINNLPIYFWDHQSPLASNALLPEEIAKEMKTEEQILAALRASHGSPPLPLPPPRSPPLPLPLPPTMNKHNVTSASAASQTTYSAPPEQKKEEKLKSASENLATITIINTAVPPPTLAEKMKRPAQEEAAPPQPTITTTDKNKNNKTKNKKTKDDKKDDNAEPKHDHNNIVEKRSQESSPTKSKKEEKVNKKDIEKEKKEWIKEGFTIVKGAEKNKEKKKQQQQQQTAAAVAPVTLADDTQTTQFDDRRKDEDKSALEEDKKKRQPDNKKQQSAGVVTLGNAAGVGAMPRRVAWSGATAASGVAVPLADIQRREREVRAAAAVAPPRPVTPPVATRPQPASGFWDSPGARRTKPAPNTSPQADFDNWCDSTLSAWRDTNIDVPTFVAFLKEIESPFEVKEYVKCYLGEGRDAAEFARQFIEKRSGGVAGGTTGASDDLCAPAAALGPAAPRHSAAAGAAQRKHKRNKMVKLDARILGFSVTAATDRINVGDIDTV